MTIRYQRAPGSLRIERVAVVEVVQELTALEAQAADVRAATLDVRRRAHRLKLGLLADHARRVALAPPRPAAPPEGVAGTAAQVVAARRRVGVSQRELAAQLGLHRSVVAMTELGKRRPYGRLARWAAGVLRAPDAQGGNHADDADEGPAEAAGGAG